MASVLAALPEQACPKAYSVPSVAVGGAPFGCFAADSEPHAAAPPTNFLRHLFWSLHDHVVQSGPASGHHLNDGDPRHAADRSIPITSK